MLRFSSLPPKKSDTICWILGIRVDPPTNTTSCTSCLQANTAISSKAERSEVREQKRQIKQLERELSRKEKALAEAAALLVLQKKVRAIFAEPEDEKSSWSNDER